MPGLRLVSVAKSFGDVRVLSGLSLDVRPGESVSIVGPSGSGKSTVLNIMGGLERPSEGEVWFADVPVHSLGGSELARYRATAIGFVFQEHHLLPQLTALENVLLAGMAARFHGSTGSSGTALDLLAAVGVDHRADALPSRMSGGERQRVAVARALLNEPALLLCDEPTGNLDAESGAGVIGLLRDASRQRGASLVLVTHNAEHAAVMDRRFVLRDGCLVDAPGLAC